MAVDGEGIELELELKWSTSDRASAESTGEESAEDESEEEDQSAEDQAEEDESVPDASAENESPEGEADEAAAGSGEAESEQPAAPDRSAEPAPGRRRASAGADKPAFNGVDNAAVRAWAAANGLTVSPRGRIRDEVIQAYRAAGN